jgi:glycosyltransferase involved in cell wall biosynthesis
MAAGIDSRVLLGADEDKSENERHISRPFVWRLADKPVRMIADRTGLHGTYRPSFRLWRRAVDAFKPDVLHLHWTYSGSTVPLTSLRSLAAAYPLVWTFHDMWAFTGGCTNSKGCERWMTGCGSCPILASGEVTGAMLPMPRDVTRLQWRVKRRALSRTPLTVVAPSAWMADIARRSPMLSHAEVVCVPNPLDTSFFSPREKKEARRSLGIPEGRLVVSFVGKPHSVFFYEGRVPLLIRALHILRESSPALAERISLLVVGGRGEELLEASGFTGVALGAVSDERRLVDCLSATDVLVNTTQYDNLPGVVQEAMSCGTVVVASDVGGLSDMLDGGKAGLLAERDSARAFATAIETVLADEGLRLRVGRRARAKAVHEYDASAVALGMAGVYERARKRHI